MAEEARVFFLRKRRERAEDTERRALLEGLGQTRSLIAQAYAGFNAAKDPDLIESYVFEINALQARYSYLLRRGKEDDGGGQGQPGVMRGEPAAKGLAEESWEGMAVETLLNALPWIVGGLILILLLAALRRPLEWLVRLAARTGVGLAALWALSGVGGLVGLHLGVNLVNALVLGVLGVPGFGLLLMLNWALAV